MRKTIIAALLVVIAPNVTAGHDGLLAEARLRASLGTLAVSHDASGPHSPYGNPTSILEYVPLRQLGAELALGGRGPGPGDPWFDVVAGVPLLSGGAFRDTDYLVGGVLFHDTWSDVAVPWQAGFSARLPMPRTEPFAHWDWLVRPYVTGAARAAHFSARGLDCGRICGNLPMFSPDTEVIGHTLLGVSAGAGLWLERSLTEHRTISVLIEAGVGYLRLMDSHHFRPDLGPVPNIVFDFAIISGRAELALSQALAGGGAVSAGVYGEMGAGLGVATFGPLLDEPIGGFPARMTELAAGITISASKPF